MSGFYYENPIIDILEGPKQEPDWLIPGFFAQGTVVILGGESGVGKSCVSYTIALAVASGVDTLSGIVPAGEPRRVLYFDEENSEPERDEYLRRAYHGLGGADKIDVLELNNMFLPVSFRLGDDDWFEQAAEFIEYWRPHMIVFDTAVSCFDTKNENDNAEAMMAMKAIRQLTRITDPVAMALVLKHAKIRVDGEKRRLRGATAWQGGADGVVFHVKSPGRPRRDRLSLTWLVPDKRRVYSLRDRVYITPEWTDDKETGLILHGSYRPDTDHERAEYKDDVQSGVIDPEEVTEAEDKPKKWRKRGRPRKKR